MMVYLPCFVVAFGTSVSVVFVFRLDDLRLISGMDTDFCSSHVFLRACNVIIVVSVFSKANVATT